MRVGVPKETAAGERRVALSPDVVRRLGKDHEVVVEAGAGEAAGAPDAQFTDAGATIGDPWGADVVAKVAAPDRGRDGQARQGLGADRLPRPAHQRPRASRRSPPPARRASRWRRSRASAARSRWTRSPARRPSPGYKAVLIAAAGAGPLLPDADDRRGHDPARPGARARRRRGRPAGDRDLAPPRRRRDRVRHPLRRQGADPVAGREVLRGRGARRRRGRGRLRPRADPGGAGDRRTRRSRSRWASRT